MTSVPSTRPGARDYYALVFGTLLGLAIIKFGNPIIFDNKLGKLSSFSEAWRYPWPSQWGIWLVAVLVLAGFVIAFVINAEWPRKKMFWIPPLLWFGWQIVSASQSVDRELSRITVWHFGACLGCYFVGASVLGTPRALRWMMVGLMAALAFCLVRAVNQRLYEFPRDLEALKIGERSGWTNFAPEMVTEMRNQGLVIATNSAEIANPTIIQKLEKKRVFGTLIYPNALAGVILLLGPTAVALAIASCRRLRPVTGASVLVITALLLTSVMFWTGSKSGWLIAVVLTMVCWLKFFRPSRPRWASLVLLGLLGLGIFAVRFHEYFSAGAKSVSARFDYWRAAVRVTAENPVLGTGPGTFQRPYERLKSSSAEMAKLTHNDYLEQFSDSGIPGGTAYLFWIGATLIGMARFSLRINDAVVFTTSLGLCGWFLQGIAEFELYVPALAWTSFVLLGTVGAIHRKQFDKLSATS